MSGVERPGYIEARVRFDFLHTDKKCEPIQLAKAPTFMDKLTRHAKDMKLWTKTVKTRTRRWRD